MYVDVAGWHLYLRDLNAAPGFKMSAALAAKFGPQVCRRSGRRCVTAAARRNASPLHTAAANQHSAAHSRPTALK